MLVKASPLSEAPDRAGLANLVAELLTEGTKRRKAFDISEEIEFIGASLNVSAGNDFTTITLSVLKKDIEKGFDVFSDILLNPTFPDEEITRKKDLIKGSLKQSEEDPSFIAGKTFKKTIYGDLPYGRLIRGSIETIDAIKREDILKFHSDYYRPNNSIISIVGDITDNEVSSLIGRFLARWEPSEIPTRSSMPEPEKERKEIIIDRDITQSNIVIGHVGISRENPDYYAVSVMNYILGGGGFSSRLMQTIRDEMGLAYDVHSFFQAYKEGGLFEVGVQTKNESASAVISEVLRQVDRIRKETVTDQELDDAKAYLTGSFPRRLDTSRKIADFLVAVEFYGLGLDYVEKYPQYINAVTKDDVLRVAKKYLDPERLVTVLVGRQSKAEKQKK
ncbi:MAG: pitrilysin family protein [Thermodesulfovibrionales bacterium]